jgi:hypothetical protein
VSSQAGGLDVEGRYNPEALFFAAAGPLKNRNRHEKKWEYQNLASLCSNQSRVVFWGGVGGRIKLSALGEIFWEMVPGRTSRSVSKAGRYCGARRALWHTIRLIGLTRSLWTSSRVLMANRACTR